MTTTIHIKENGFELGYDAAEDFTRAFKRNVGIPPRDF